MISCEYDYVYGEREFCTEHQKLTLYSGKYVNLGLAQYIYLEAINYECTIIHICFRFCM